MKPITLAEAKKIIHFYKDGHVTITIFRNVKDYKVVFTGKFRDIPEDLLQNYLLDFIMGNVFFDEETRQPQGGLYISLCEK